ncbi:multiprotein-bridging factor 1 family protein [Salinarimonas sp.]|uniref:helix-turn-helix domain-containing protein n=1 Tax=Salinarimonas sp. TaxID=2766526 RepID=UPI003919739A
MAAKPPRLTADQVRAARALLRWSQKDLADASNVSVPTIARLELGHGALAGTEQTAAALRKALEEAGVVFIDQGDGGGVGVRFG